MATAWEDRPLDTITASHIDAMQHQMAATARLRRNCRGRAVAAGTPANASSPPYGRGIGLIYRKCALLGR
jgi:hypothetical protein